MADFAGTGTEILVSKKYWNLAGTGIGIPVVHYSWLTKVFSQG